MKTIKQIADEFGVTKDTIKHRVKNLPDMFKATQRGIIYITLDGIMLLRESVLGVKPGLHLGEPTKSGVNPPMHPPQESPAVIAVIETLREELEVKNRQIEAMNLQISDLTTALTTAQQTASTAQALHAGTMKHLLDAESKSKPSFFSRVFGGSKNMSRSPEE
jgi:predicted transcriptional regulator